MNDTLVAAIDKAIANKPKFLWNGRMYLGRGKTDPTPLTAGDISNEVAGLGCSKKLVRMVLNEIGYTMAQICYNGKNRRAIILPSKVTGQVKLTLPDSLPTR